MACTQDEMKRAVARAALEYVDVSAVIGVGSGTTVNHFIELLGADDRRPQAAVATSNETRSRLESIGVRVITLGEAARPTVYVDGADEVDPIGRMIKGAGGAHTEEKRVARASHFFVCIVDASKTVRQLGDHAPVPLEVLPEAFESVSDAVRELGGSPRLRESQRTDQGNLLVDVTALSLDAPEALEIRLDAIPGVVECGIFARRRADVVLIGERDGTVSTRRLR